MNKGYFSGVRRNTRSSLEQGFNADKVAFTPFEDDTLSIRNFLYGFEPPHSRYKNKQYAIQKRYPVDVINTDVKSWRSTRVDNTLTSDATYQNKSVAFGNDIWVAVGMGSSTCGVSSTNGATWATISSLATSGTAFNQVVFGNNLWVTVGNSGLIRTSTNGTAWTARASNFGATAINSVAYGNGIFVAGGVAGQLRTSTDGITWVTQTSNFGATAINSVAYGNGIFVAGGVAGELRTSTDGITWVTQTSNFGATAINSVAYGNGLWVINNGSEIRSSTDAITWITRTSLPSSFVYCIGYYNNIWIAGGVSAIYLSTDLNKWTIKSPIPTIIGGSNSPGPIYSLAYGKGILVGVSYLQIRSGPLGYYRYEQGLLYSNYSEYIVQ